MNWYALFPSANICSPHEDELTLPNIEARLGIICATTKMGVEM